MPLAERIMNSGTSIMRGAEMGNPMKTRRPATLTSHPDTPAPQLRCPECERPLVYLQTAINGITPVERWDFLECWTCGPFVYRRIVVKFDA